MLENNRYYIVDLSDPNLSDIYKIIVGEEETQRKSIDKTKIIVKLKKGDNKNHECLNNSQEFTHEQILEISQDENWSSNIF